MRISSFPVVLFLLLLVGASPSLFAQSVTYVSVGGSGAGSSWSDAAGNLQQVLAQAQQGDEIWVAQGTYAPTSCSNCSTNDRDKTFLVPAGTSVYGGFVGTESTRNERNPKLNVTTLSGDIDADGQATRNSYHVVSFRHAGSDTRLDGFTITKGQASGSNERQHGAGIYNDGSGGGNRSQPVIANCRVVDNRASGNGGGLYNNGFFGDASPTLLDCEFSSNKAREGGAMHNQGYAGESSPIVRRTTFTGNASGAGGAVYNSGNNGTSTPTYEACGFLRNDCSGYGGAVYNFAKDASASCEARFINCIFDGNNGDGAAGAVYTLGSSGGVADITLLGCVVYDNYSRVGGGVYVNASDNGSTTLHITNSIIAANRGNFDRTLHFSGNSNPKIILNYCQVDAANCGAVTQSGGGILTCGANVLFNANPGFADAGNGDFRLLAGAAGIDRGDAAAAQQAGVTTDYAGNARVQGTRPDLGAFEFSTGDSDGDGVLDLSDNCVSTPNPAQIDADGDGYGAACDCDDTDAAVNPDASEVCDGVDNDCNGQTDEAGGTQTFYADADGDGFGDLLTATTACVAPTGYVTNATDCDDTNDAIYPGAVELCDGLDNDCNGTIDDGAVDDAPPSITCKSLSLSLVPGGTVSITPQQVYANGSDNCSTVTLVSAQPSSFMLPGSYQVTLTAEDDAGNRTSCTAQVTVTFASGPISYCAAKSSQPWVEWIANVAFADLDNASSKCGTTCGYSDFTSETAQVETGNTYPLTLTPGLSWSGYRPDLYWRAYIDWNQNGSFTDAGELVAQDDDTFSPVQAMVSVPTSARAGNTRMRIVMERGSAPSACGSYTNGEVEDYTVAVAVGGPRVQIMGCPADIDLSVLPGDTSGVASWNAPTVTTTCTQGGELITQQVGLSSGAAFPLGTSTVSYAATDACGSTAFCSFTVTVTARPAVLSLSCPADQQIQLAAGQTQHTLAVALATATTTCPGGATVTQVSGPLTGEQVGAGSYTVVFEAVDGCSNTERCTTTISVLPVQTNPGSYCDAQSSQPWTEWIANVKLENIDNASGKCDTKCGYGDFTNLVAGLQEGTASRLTLTPGLSWSGHNPDLHWRVWMDWNGDGDFTDANERVAQAKPGNQSVTRTLTPPLGSSGIVRMRVAMRKDQFADPCENFVFGEVEDYSVLIAAANRPVIALQSQAHQAQTHQLSLKLNPNPAHAWVRVSASEGLSTVVVLSATGAELSRIETTSDQITVATEGLPAGVYFVQVVTATGSRSTRRLLIE